MPLLPSQDPQLEALKAQLSTAQGEIEKHRAQEKEAVLNGVPAHHYANEEQVI